MNPFLLAFLCVASSLPCGWPSGGVGAGSCWWRVAGKGLSGETWGWEKSRHLLMNFYHGGGRVELGRRESSELQLCWGWEGAARLSRGLMLEPSSWEGLFLERKGYSARLRLSLG